MFLKNSIKIESKENLFLDIINYCLSISSLNSREVSFLRDLFLKIRLRRVTYLTYKQVSWLWNIAKEHNYNSLILYDDVESFIKNVSE